MKSNTFMLHPSVGTYKKAYLVPLEQGAHLVPSVHPLWQPLALVMYEDWCIGHIALEEPACLVLCVGEQLRYYDIQEPEGMTPIVDAVNSLFPSLLHDLLLKARFIEVFYCSFGSALRNVIRKLPRIGILMLAALEMTIPTDDPCAIVYTHPTTRKRLRTRIGRMIGTHCPLIPLEWAEDFARAQRLSIVELVISNEEEHVLRAFVNGPSSCMGGKPSSFFGSSCHPALAYAGPDSDLAVAYVLCPDDSITARAVVWPEKKRHSTAYGDRELITKLLAEQGYVHGDFDGACIANLTRSTGDDDFIVPYLDNLQSFDVYSDRQLLITDDGDYTGNSTNGIVSCSLLYCTNCESRVSEDDARTVNNETWCQSCYEDHISCCGCCNEYYDSRDGSTRIDRYDYWCNSCVENNAVTTSCCNTLVPTEAALECETCSEYFCARCGISCGCESDDEDEDEDDDEATAEAARRAAEEEKAKLLRLIEAQFGGLTRAYFAGVGCHCPVCLDLGVSDEATAIAVWLMGDRLL